MCGVAHGEVHKHQSPVEIRGDSREALENGEVPTIDGTSSSGLPPLFPLLSPTYGSGQIIDSCEEWPCCVSREFGRSRISRDTEDAIPNEVRMFATPLVRPRLWRTVCLVVWRQWANPHLR
jgi:hypothetical protein